VGRLIAEVIGDPIAQSKSPIIHKYWLDRLGIDGDYIRTQVGADGLRDFLERRRSDRAWRGCNVTIPHKQNIITLLDKLDPGARTIAAVNCVVPEGVALVGYNTDVDGVAVALDSVELRGGKAALIGAGGGARAVIAYLANRGIEEIAIVARNLGRAESLRALAPGAFAQVVDFNHADVALRGAAAIINTSPLGMGGAQPMQPSLLKAVQNHAMGATLFDLVTTPVETEFLAAGKVGGGLTVDGLTMLVGQAARAFELFFGAPAPAPDRELHNLLMSRESK
jgi:shikimate dehydrogenase